MRSKYNKILASKSPRRAEILNMIGIDFKVIPSNIKEDFNNDIMPQKIAEDLSLEKKKNIHRLPSRYNNWCGHTCCIKRSNFW